MAATEVPLNIASKVEHTWPAPSLGTFNSLHVPGRKVVHGNRLRHHQRAKVSAKCSRIGQLVARPLGHRKPFPYLRDVTLQEDACRIPHGQTSQNFTAKRNADVTLLRFHGHTNLAADFRACASNTQRRFAMLEIFKN